MKERPIVLSGAEVSAILDGRKSMTRRVIEPQPREDITGVHFPWASFYSDGSIHTWDNDGVGGQNWHQKDYPDEDPSSVALQHTPYENACPHGVPGDRLWVQEEWYEPPGEPRGQLCFYRCNTEGVVDEPWQPAASMPRWFSRITLEITEVRVERLQDISEKDAETEGYDTWADFVWSPWASKHWDANPWVWVIKFRRVEGEDGE